MPHFDAVITEASYLKKGGMIRRDKKTGRIFGHAGIPNLLSKLKSKTQLVIFVHFGSWYLKDKQEALTKFKELEKEFDVKIIPATDGMEIDV
jgi:ribonuclease BN (tRNA processing enzyme)